MLETIAIIWSSSGFWALSPRTPWVDSFMPSWSSRLWSFWFVSFKVEAYEDPGDKKVTRTIGPKSNPAFGTTAI